MIASPHATWQAGRETEQPDSVVETRVTGFGVHALILCSALVVPLLSLVPLPVVAGVFLYLGRKVMSGNQFLRRCKQLFIDDKVPPGLLLTSSHISHLTSH